MKKMRKNRTGRMTRVVLVLVAMTIGFPMVPGLMPAAKAGDAGAFVGGMVAGHVIGNAARRSERRTEAAEYQAYSQPRTQQAAPAPAPAPAAPQTKEQKLQELDKLASGGYITPAEYKSRKKAILDGN